MKKHTTMGNPNKTHTRFHLRLFWSVVAAFLLLGLCFISFQYVREKQYKINLLNSRLTEHNDYIDGEMRRGKRIGDIALNGASRISLFDLSGKMLYDSSVPDVSDVENHSDRKEIRDAIQKGAGYDVNRRSKLTGEVYFYSAKRYGEYIICSALPYGSDLVQTLEIDYIYIVLAIAILLAFAAVFYNVMKHLGENINRLNDFATKAEQGGIDEYPAHFPNDDLGEISRHIVQIYNRLQKTKQALVTEQERVLEQQKEQARIKRQLTQNIAHELKTPVSSIQGYLETIINTQGLPPETERGFLEKCYQQSTRLTALLHDISSLTRIDEAPELIKKERVDLSTLIKDILGEVALNLKERNISVYNRTEGATLVCNGSPSLLYSIFRNLVDNTIAYAGDNVSIYIDCNTEEPDLYFFSYSDNGVGIGEEHLNRIFERFYRIDKGRSRKAGGTGLGLSVAKNAVLFHGGSISARQRPGGGLEFVFSIRRN